METAELEVLRQERDAALAELRTQVVIFRAVRAQYLYAEEDWLMLKERYEKLEYRYAVQTKLQKVAARAPAPPKPPKQRLESIVKKMSSSKASKLLEELEAMLRSKKDG